MIFYFIFMAEKFSFQCPEIELRKEEIIEQLRVSDTIENVIFTKRSGRNTNWHLYFQKIGKSRGGNLLPSIFLWTESQVRMEN